MGVLQCDRSGCKNIRCQKHSCEVGYICYDCYNELDNLFIRKGGEITLEEIKEFMNTPKKNDRVISNLYEFFGD